jgi:PhnB protein
MSTGTEAAGDEAEIRAFVEAMAKALHDRDADALVARLAPDVLVYDLAPPLWSRGAEVEREKTRAWLATKTGPIGYEVRDLRIEVGGAVAFSTCLARMRATGVDGDEADLWLRNTVCYRKAGSRWQVAHHHESVPFHMDGSFRAAIDLEP